MCNSTNYLRLTLSQCGKEDFGLSATPISFKPLVLIPCFFWAMANWLDCVAFSVLKH